MLTGSVSTKAGAADPPRTRGADNGDIAGAWPRLQCAPPRWARPPASAPDGLVALRACVHSAHGVYV